MPSVTCAYDKEYPVSCGLIRQYMVCLHYQNPLQDDDDIAVSCQFEAVI